MTIEGVQVLEDGDAPPSFDGHEDVRCWRDPESGLFAVVAIHSTSLGPAVGGCRSWNYPSDSAAIEDALRLSKGMTWKNALAGLPFGGGKAVVRATNDDRRRSERLRAFGRFVDTFEGRYITAEDVGTGIDEIETIALETEHVAGRALGTAGGDPSPKTALGVYLGMRAAVAHRLGRAGLAGLRVAVQGLGSVGMALCERLHRDGVSLVVADLDPIATSRARSEFGASVVSPDAILDAEVEVFSPCALGGVLDDDAIRRLNAVVVAGAANNQLAEPRHAMSLHDRGILYAPDYLVNAGGIINIGVELMGDYDEDASLREVHRIEARATSLFERAARERRTPEDIADAMVRERLAAATRE